jgi:hypothetical protein
MQRDGHGEVGLGCHELAGYAQAVSYRSIVATHEPMDRHIMGSTQLPIADTAVAARRSGRASGARCARQPCNHERGSGAAGRKVGMRW